jgi:hypothetical protein
MREHRKHRAPVALEASLTRFAPLLQSIRSPPPRSWMGDKQSFFQHPSFFWGASAAPGLKSSDA